MEKAEKRESKSSGGEKYVGLLPVYVKAVNPTIKERNKLFGIEDGDEDKELEYLSADGEKLKLNFYLYSEDLDKYFVNSVTLNRGKEVKSTDGLKTQFVNGTCTSTWVDDEANLPEWFTNFQTKEKENIGAKPYRVAIQGEEKLYSLMRKWLGLWNFYDTNGSTLVDIDKLYNEDYSELQDLIESGYDTPFVALIGVRTDDEDKTKQYQSVYGKEFLPYSFMKDIEKKFKGSKPYVTKTWDKFEEEVYGKYGFDAYFKLEPVSVYNPAEDPAVSTVTKTDATPTNSKY